MKSHPKKEKKEKSRADSMYDEKVTEIESASLKNKESWVSPENVKSVCV